VRPSLDRTAGDFDADGLPDLVVAGKGGCFLLHNVGGGRFEEAFDAADSILSQNLDQITGRGACQGGTFEACRFLEVHPDAGRVAAIPGGRARRSEKHESGLLLPPNGAVPV
jgi:hypothetical protein